MWLRLVEAFVASGFIGLGGYYMFLLVNEQKGSYANPYAYYPDSYPCGYLWEENEEEQEEECKHVIGFQYREQ